MFRLFSFMAIVVFLLSSCVSGGPRLRTRMFEDAPQKADIRIEQVVKAVENKDKEALKVQFSEQAVNEAEDLDNRIDYLMDFIKGDIISWERQRWSAEDAINYGDVAKRVIAWYEIKTDECDYLAFIIECIKDTEHPENIGLYTLRIIRAEDEETQFATMESMEIAGIYKPEESDKID